MKAKIRAVFLDWHGVIYDGEVVGRHLYKWTLYDLYGKTLNFTREKWEKVEEEAYQNFLQTWKELTTQNALPYRSVIQKAESAYYRTLSRAAGIPDKRSDEEIFQQSRELNYRVASSYDATYPDVRPVLEELRNKKIKLFLITSATEDYIRGSLIGSKLQNYFEKIFSAESIHFSKFHPGFWQEIFEISTFSPSTCMVVDDSYECLKIPYNAGALCLLMARSGSRAEEKAFPIPTIDTADKILAYL